MEYSLTTIDHVSGDVLDLVEFLVDEEFLVDLQNCRHCGANIILEHFNGNDDGVVWRCTNQACRRYQSVRDGSFFAFSNLSLHKQIRLIIIFVSEGSPSSAARLLDISRQTATNYFIECRRMYDAELNLTPISFTNGGEYEVDECIIKRVKIMEGVYDVVWVQSILERVTGKVFLHRIPNRARPNMVPPIQLRVPANSVVFTDEHASYGNLRRFGYYHASVNHTRGEYQRWGNVAGRRRNIHINTCEGINSMIRRRLTYKSRRTIEYLDLILSEIMYRKSRRSLFDPFK
jgi:transposase-like protein